MSYLEFPDSGDRRKSSRTLMGYELTARCFGGDPFRMSIVDISRGGFRASADRVLLPGMLVTVTLPNGVSRAARIVRVGDGTIAGQFLHRLNPADLTLGGE